MMHDGGDDDDDDDVMHMATTNMMIKRCIEGTGCFNQYACGCAVVESM